jgi:hypothetical protein
MTELLFLQWRHLRPPERICLAALLLTLVVWLLLPAIPQDQGYHLNIAWYGFAKLAEAADHMIWTASVRRTSGGTRVEARARGCRRGRLFDAAVGTAEAQVA